MTLQEIRQAIRDNILERTEGFWSDQELNRAINAGYMDLIAVDPPSTSTTIQLQEDVDLYSLPADLIAIEAVIYDGRDLLPYRYMVYPPYKGEPAGYQLIGDQIRFFPTPDKTYEVTLHYTYQPPELVNDTDEPVIPKHYHNLLVLYGTYWALRKDGDPMYAAYQQDYNNGKAQLVAEASNRQQHRTTVVQDPSGMWW